MFVLIAHHNSSNIAKCSIKAFVMYPKQNNSYTICGAKPLYILQHIVQRYVDM